MTRTRSTILRDSAAAILLVAAAAGVTSTSTPDWTPPTVGTTVYLPTLKYKIEGIDGDIVSRRFVGGPLDGQLRRFQRNIVAADNAEYDATAVRSLWPLTPRKTVSFQYKGSTDALWRVQLSALDPKVIAGPPDNDDTIPVRADNFSADSAARATYTYWLDRVTGLPVRTDSDLTDTEGANKRTVIHALRIDPPNLPSARPTTYDGTWSASSKLERVREGGNPDTCRDYTYDITLRQGRVTHINIFGRAVPNPTTNDYFAGPHTIDILWETSRGNARIHGTFDGNVLKGHAASGNCLHTVEWRRK